MPRTEPLTVLSLGWGVQSWTLAAMVALKELPPVDCAIHADTTHEASGTYEHAKKWTPWLEDQGVLVVGSEQVDLGEYMFLSGDVGGEIYPGVEKRGSVAFGLKRTTVQEIQSARLIIDPAHDDDFENTCDADYEFMLDLSDVQVAE